MTTKLPRAKKLLGQNWLVNEGVLDRIVVAADIQSGETVLEIGPGTGALTKRLVATGAQVIAIEKDRGLIEQLRNQFPNVEIIEGDTMDFSPNVDKVVANIPYYLTSRLIRLITEKWRPKRAVLMVQHEVAKRMLAKPPDMNILALSVQLYAKPSLVMRVSRGSFRPSPEVDSAVIQLDMEPLKQGQREQNEVVLALAKKAFSQKRKQLKFGQNPKARPQELSIKDWENIVTDLH